MEPLLITDKSIDNQSYWRYIYAMRPNQSHNARGRLGELLPQRPYCHRYRFDPVDLPVMNIIPWLDQIMWIRSYYANAERRYRHPVRFPR